MSQGNFAPPSTNVGTGNTPINLAIGRLNSRALLVLVENSQSLRLDMVEVSSMWRNSGSHTSGRGIDLVAARRNGVARFNNEGGEARSALAAEVFNAFRNDNRVSQVYDPWEMYDVRWQTPVIPNIWRSFTSYLNLSPLHQRMYEHRNHMHITVLP